MIFSEPFEEADYTREGRVRRRLDRLDHELAQARAKKADLVIGLYPPRQLERLDETGEWAVTPVNVCNIIATRYDEQDGGHIHIINDSDATRVKIGFDEIVDHGIITTLNPHITTTAKT